MSIHSNNIVGLRELSRYKVGEAAEVTIFGDYRQGIGRYVVKEPSLSESGKVIYDKLMKEIHESPTAIIIESGRDEDEDKESSSNSSSLSTTTATTAIESLKREIEKAAVTLDIVEEVQKERHAILYKYSKEILGLGKADVLFADPDLEEITLPKAPESVFVIHRRFSQFNYMETNVRFNTTEEADRFIQRLMHRVERTPSVANPIMDGTNNKGDRHAVFYGDEVSRSSSFSTRKPSRTARGLDQLVDSKMLSKEVADYLISILRAKGVLFVVGSTGSGKTTLLNGLVNQMPSNWKIITIEETPEIQLSHRIWVSLFTRFSMQSAYSISIMDLVKASLRHRPDLLVVGETRGEEVREMFQAAATGHGLISTFHATDTLGMLSRMRGKPLNVEESFIQLVWAVVTVRNVVIGKEGKSERRIVAIDEIVRNEQGSYSIENVYAYDFASDKIVSKMKEGTIQSPRMKEAQILLGKGPQ